MYLESAARYGKNVRFGGKMRMTRAFVLRLFVDSKKPQDLRGTARSVTEDEEQSFVDGQSLLALLERMIRPFVETGETDNPAQTPTSECYRERAE